MSENVLYPQMEMFLKSSLPTGFGGILFLVYDPYTIYTIMYRSLCFFPISVLTMDPSCLIPMVAFQLTPFRLMLLQRRWVVCSRSSWSLLKTLVGWWWYMTKVINRNLPPKIWGYLCRYNMIWLTNGCWLMISSGVILTNILGNGTRIEFVISPSTVVDFSQITR